MPTFHDRIAGGLWGLLVGDVLGVPYEFHPPDELPPLHELEMIPPAGFRRAHASVSPGTWSDDGAQALALLDSLLHCGRLDPDDFGRRLLDWYQRGYLAIDGDVFDIGIQTRSALHALRDGAPALEAGPRHEDANGNGSLMRALPLALWHRGSDEDLVRDAHLQSRITHGHPRAQICCALYVLWARYLLRGGEDAWSLATARLRKIYGASPDAMELESFIRPDAPPKGRGTGYVVDALHSARQALAADSYENVVKRAIAFGNDTDTTACIAGGIAGVRDGVGAIPERWMLGLRGREIVQPLLDRLLDRWGSV